MKHILLFIGILFSGNLLAKNHFVMISDSRGNCAFALQLFKQFHNIENSTFTFRSSGGSTPFQWVRTDRRTFSPAGIELKGKSGKYLGPKRIMYHKVITPNLKSYLNDQFKSLNKEDRKVVLVNLGTNQTNSDDLYKNSTTVLKTIQEQNAACIWIGPPHNTKWDDTRTLTQNTTIQKAILDSNVNCHFINSFEISHYPFTARSRQVDLIHYCWDKYVEKAGRDWADRTFDEILFFLNISGQSDT